jgi:hypothetical protein
LLEVKLNLIAGTKIEPFPKSGIGRKYLSLIVFQLEHSMQIGSPQLACGIW